MFGLTSLGVVHTAISLVAVVAAVISFMRFGKILPGTTLERVYLWTTVLTCVTSFGIFQHGGFGKAHVLGIITLVTLAVVWLAGRKRLFGSASPYVETVGYSATFLFHMIPAITETSTRLPLGNPLLASAEAPALQAATGVLLLLFLLGATVQVLRMRSASRLAPA